MWGYRPTKAMVVFSAIGTSVGAIVLLKEFAGGCQYLGKERLDGKNVIITGGNRGIGKEVARNLAGRGASIILACRDMESCQEIRKEIVLETRNRNINCRELNLGSLKSINKFVASIEKDVSEVNLLINNAGVYKDSKTRELTEDGFEVQLGVNHLGPFLLSNKLLPKLIAGQPSRMVNVSSVAHSRGEIDYTDLNWDNNYDGRPAYNRSKLANVLFTKELANRLEGTNVTVCAVHPGLVKTDLFKDMSFNNSYISWAIVNPLLFLVMKTPLRGAQPVIHCALSPNIETGKYYSNCKESDPSEAAKDSVSAKTLWKISEKWTRLT